MVVIWASLTYCGNFSVSKICDKRESSLYKSTGSATLKTSGGMLSVPGALPGFVRCVALLISSLLRCLPSPWATASCCLPLIVPGLTAEGRVSNASKCSLHRLRIASSIFISGEPSAVFSLFFYTCTGPLHRFFAGDLTIIIIELMVINGQHNLRKWAPGVQTRKRNYKLLGSIPATPRLFICFIIPDSRFTSFSSFYSCKSAIPLWGMWGMWYVPSVHDCWTAHHKPF